MPLTQREAQAIARKLDAEIKKGAKHDQAIIRYANRIVARYGIRRASKAVGHSYIPKQLFISPQQALDLAQCPLDKDEYFEILRKKGFLPPEN